VKGGHQGYRRSIDYKLLFLLIYLHRSLRRNSTPVPMVEEGTSVALIMVSDPISASISAFLR